MKWHLFYINFARCLQVVIKEKVLELLLYFTKHEDEEVKSKAIIGLGKNKFFFNLTVYRDNIFGMSVCGCQPLGVLKD